MNERRNQCSICLSLQRFQIKSGSVLLYQAHSLTFTVGHCLQVVTSSSNRRRFGGFGGRSVQ
jgi:hypothetical protein